MKSIFSVILLLPFIALSQGVGSSSFGVTQIPVSALSAAMGGSQVAIFKDDVLQLADNPAFYDSTLHRSLTFNYLNYVTNINQASFGYAKMVHNVGLVSGYLRFMNYGSFTETDEVGNEIGKFSASDYELGLSLTKRYVKNISYGFTFKQLFSAMYQASAYGVAADAGVYYHSDNQNFTAGIVLNDFGLKIKDYTNSNNEWLETQVSLAMSKKFSKAPIRIGFQYSNLQKWDLAEPDGDAIQNTKQDPITKEVSRPIVTIDNFLRHISTNVVFEPNPKFNLFAGYEFRRRLELATIESPGAIGFSFGARIQIKRFGIQYSYSNYSLSAGSSHFALTTNLGAWYSKI